ncbi:hypothetical protein ACKWTF_014440 [Chironomus riparius]
MDQSKNIFVDCSLESVKESYDKFDLKSSFNYQEDFQSCKIMDIPTKLCMLRKNHSPDRSFCFPQLCTDEKIRDFIGKTYENTNGSVYDIECKNIYDPETYFILVGSFIFLLTLITLLSTLINANQSKFINLLPSKMHGLVNMSSIFSISENIKTLFNMKSSSTSIDCLNGLKALSLIPIVFLHSMQNAWPIPDPRFYNTLLYVTGILPTDTFFLVSGILCAKFYMTRRNIFSKFFRTLFERYLRLTPSGVVTFAVFIAIKLFLSPFGYPNLFHPIFDDCKKNWWVMLIYLQNYYESEHACFGTYWFATVLFQLYFITPFILFILNKLKSQFGKILMLLMLITTFVPGFMTGMTNNSFYSFLYIEALSRSYPYLVGLFYYRITSGSGKLASNTQTKLAWIATTLTLIVPLIPFFSESMTIEISNIFYIPIRIFWPFALCWIVHVCHNGFGRIVNNILSANILVPVSNLSLGIYLVNVLVSHLLSFLTPFIPPVESKLVNSIRFFIANFIISTFLATLLYLFVEVPFTRISKSSCKKTNANQTVKTV